VVDLGWTAAAAAVLGVFMAVNGVYMLVSPGNFRIAQLPLTDILVLVRSLDVIRGTWQSQPQDAGGRMLCICTRRFGTRLAGVDRLRDLRRLNNFA
jgi:hypothetical protein